MSSTRERRRLAVIGAGKVGQAVGGLWLAAGHEVIFGSRDPSRDDREIARLGGDGQVTSPAKAAAAADIVLLAVPGETVGQLIGDIGGFLRGKIVIDATNTELAYLDGRRASALLFTEGRRTAGMLPDSTVVRAFSHIPAELLRVRGAEQSGRWAMAFAGDVPEAKQTVAGLMRDAGWVPVDLGGLDDSAALDPGGAVFRLFYTEAQMRDVVGIP